MTEIPEDIERRMVLATWLRWTSLARVVEAANLAGITDPLERYRFVAERAHGMSGARLDDYLRFAKARLADGHGSRSPSASPRRTSAASAGPRSCASMGSDRPGIRPTANAGATTDRDGPPSAGRGRVRATEAA